MGCLAVVLLVGCNGGTVDRHSLTNDGATVASINCEAWLLARAETGGRLTAPFAREQAKALRVQAANLADALGRRSTVEGLEPHVRAKGRAAGVLAERLGRLISRRTSRATAAELAQQFRRAGRCS